MNRKNGSRKRRGAGLLLVVLSALTLMGLGSLCVDGAVLYARKQAVMNACDAAALAGGSELPEQEAAEASALRTASANDVPQAGLEISFPAVDEIDVQTVEEVPLGLGRVFGMTSVPVSGHARARLEIPNVIHSNSPAGLRPWAIDSSWDFSSGTPIRLKEAATGEERIPGNYGIVQLEAAPGANVYRTSIIRGGTGVYRVGAMLKTEPGNKEGPTAAGVSELLRLAQEPPWSGQTAETATIHNPRVVILPIVDWSYAEQGRTEVPLKGFVAFYLNGSDLGQVDGVFLPHIQISNGSTDPGSPMPSRDTGIRVVRLVQ